MNPPPPPPPSLHLAPPQFAVAPLPSHIRHSSPSLSTVFSDLSSLIDLSSIVLSSLPVLSSANTTLLPCPLNPAHQVLPSSLFSHYLRCPSIISLADTLRYTENLFAPPSSAIFVPRSSSDLCFSLENYFCHDSSTSNFFYQNCPGPIIVDDNNRPFSPIPSLTLPKILYLECANRNKDEESSEPSNPSVFSAIFIKILPSEIMSIKNEMEGRRGRGFPTTYSYSVLRAILRLQDCLLLQLYEWFLENSPKYGVIIDVAMRDHICWLVKLCLKAIIREAFGLAKFLFGNEESYLEDKTLLRSSNRRFECPVLFDVFTWLAAQFGILYGEVIGNLLAFDVLKECVLESSLDSSFFSLKRKDSEMSDICGLEDELEQIIESSEWKGDRDDKRNQRYSIKGQTVGNCVIFVSQVAAAVAALHERRWVESYIRAVRESTQLSAYQRNVQHTTVSKIADEERLKRPEYRPLIEHDGILWQRPGDQGSSKVKSKEELLAEERDYKRRRMSYRGKKSKRNTTEVMRNIIQEYMEEIKQALGTDNMSNTTDEAMSASENLCKQESAVVASESRRKYQHRRYNDGQSHGNSDELYSHNDSENISVDVPRHLQDFGYNAQYSNRNLENGQNKDNNSKSVDKRYNRNHIPERVDCERKADDVEVDKEGFSTRSYGSRMSRESDSYKRRDEYTRNSHKRERDEKNWDYRDRGRNRTRDTRNREEDIEEHNDQGQDRTFMGHGDIQKDVDSHHNKGRSRIHKNVKDGDAEGGGGEDRKRWRDKPDKNSRSRTGMYIGFEDRYDPTGCS